MKLVVTLIGMAILGWIVATELNTAKTISVAGAPQGTPQQIMDGTKQRLDQINKDAQKRAEMSDPSKLPGAVPASTPADVP